MVPRRHVEFVRFEAIVAARAKSSNIILNFESSHRSGAWILLFDERV
jgi:hypothetical protein